MNTPTLSTVEAARMLGRTPQCIGLWCRSGRIESERDASGCFRIPEAAVMGLTSKTRSLVHRKTHTIAEVAALLGISKPEVKKLCDRRHLAYLKLPTGRILIEASEVERFIERYRA